MLRFLCVKAYVCESICVKKCSCTIVGRVLNRLMMEFVLKKCDVMRCVALRLCGNDGLQDVTSSCQWMCPIVRK